MIDWFEIRDKDSAQTEIEDTRDNFEEYEAGLSRMGVI
jgi:hypothetical protein